MLRSYAEREDIPDEARVQALFFIAQGNIYKTSVTSGGVVPLETTSVVATVLALDDTYVYWGDDTGRLFRMLRTGAGNTLVSNPEGPFRTTSHIITDSTRVFWLERHSSGGATIRRASRTGDLIAERDVGQFAAVSRHAQSRPTSGA